MMNVFYNTIIFMNIYEMSSATNSSWLGSYTLYFSTVNIRSGDMRIGT